jgi:proteic killer suppression protein
MIKTFRDAATAELFATGKSRHLHHEVFSSGLRALAALNAATTLHDLRGTGRQLEEVAGGRYTIRVNSKYRVRFRWVDGHAYDVELLNPHKG